MSRIEAWCLHVSSALVAGTGAVYAWMRYALERTDPFAVVNHPLQPDVQHAHVLAAPLLVFASGLVWSTHVWPRVRSGFASRRASGLALAAALLPMIASGYAIQVAADEAWRTAWIWVHVASSALWILAYGAHQLQRRARVPA